MFYANGQDKILTMEDAVLGYQLRPQSRYMVWQGDKNVLTYIEGENLVGEQAGNGEKSVLLTVADLNKLLGADLKGWPQFSWKDGETITVARQGKYYEINVGDKSLKRTLVIPEEAGNLSFNGTNAFAFTRGNNL